MPSLIHPEGTIHADRLARREAIVLAALSKTHWPEPLILDGDTITSPIIDRAIPFAASARRVLDHMEWDVEIEETTYDIDGLEDPSKLQRNLRMALNGIVHATSLHVISCVVHEEVAQFEGVRAYAPVFLRYQTDRYPLERVSIYDMAFAYLRQPKLVLNHPEA